MYEFCNKTYKMQTEQKHVCQHQCQLPMPMQPDAHTCSGCVPALNSGDNLNSPKRYPSSVCTWKRFITWLGGTSSAGGGKRVFMGNLITVPKVQHTAQPSTLLMPATHDRQCSNPGFYRHWGQTQPMLPFTSPSMVPARARGPSTRSSRAATVVSSLMLPLAPHGRGCIFLA